MKEATESQTHAPNRTTDLSSALEALPRLLEPAQRVVLFLDYDGTLSPIVARPEEAQISQEVRNLVAELADLCPTAIVSGRDRADVERRVGVPEAYYVGSHGFDIEGPGGIALHLGQQYVPALGAVESALRARLAAIPGALIERKRFSLATHYRLVEREQVPAVSAIVDEILTAHENLRREPGKEVIEIRPNVAWDKGKAVLWLIEALGLEDALPIHIGDDLTDETVFAVLEDRGVGIFVGEEARPTSARYRLRDPNEVERWLRELIVALRARTTGRAGRERH